MKSYIILLVFISILSFNNVSAKCLLDFSKTNSSRYGFMTCRDLEMYDQCRKAEDVLNNIQVNCKIRNKYLPFSAHCENEIQCRAKNFLGDPMIYCESLDLYEKCYKMKNILDSIPYYEYTNFNPFNKPKIACYRTPNEIDGIKVFHTSMKHEIAPFYLFGIVATVILTVSLFIETVTGVKIFRR